MNGISCNGMKNHACSMGRSVAAWSFHAVTKASFIDFSSWIYLKRDPNPMEFQASVRSICVGTQHALYASYNCLLFRDILWCCSLISVVYCMILEYCVCGCLCVYLHMFGVWVCIGGSMHSWLDARWSPYTPPSCSLLSPPACCSGFSWDSNLQQRLSSPHTRQG